MNKLYVIGNGFDLHHGMACSYKDFENWLELNHQDVYKNLKRLYGDIGADWWSKFEDNLARFDPNHYPNMVGREPFFVIQNKLVDLYGEEARDAINYYELVNLDGVRNRFRLAETIAQFEMNKLSIDLKEAFGEWVKNIEIKDKNCIQDLDTDATFFTFNYTKTLENLYGVDEDNVFHLHGSVDKGELIFGHGLTYENMVQRDFQENVYERELKDNGEDEARLELFKVIENELKKPVEDIIDTSHEHFNALEGIEEMEVLGFSYSKIDLPYLRKILDIAGKDIHVIFGWHTEEEDKQNAKAFRAEMRLTNCELKYF